MSVSPSVPAMSRVGDAALLASGLARLDEALTMLSGVDPAGLPSAGLGDQVLALLTARRRIDGVVAPVVARFAASGDWAVDGARNPAAWIRGRTVDGLGPAKAVLAVAEWSSRFPHMHAALVAGVVSVGHVRCLAEAHARFPRLSPGLSVQEAAIVDLARVCEPREFTRRLLTLCHRLDPAGVDADLDDDRRRDYLAVSTSLNGRVRVDGWLPADLGAQLLAALEAATRAVTDQPPADPGGDAQQGEADPFALSTPMTQPVTVDSRTRSQRNLDALRRILATAATVTGPDGLPTVAGARPVVHVTIPATALTDDHVLGVLERAGIPTAALSAATTAQATCDAALTPWVIDRAGAIQAQLPTVRTIHPALRRAITTRDVHCRFPGCRNRIDEVHHIVYWRHGGRTERGNLIGLCWWHHHQIHHGRWTLTGHPDTTITLTQHNTHHNAGRTYTSDPPGDPPGDPSGDPVEPIPPPV